MAFKLIGDQYSQQRRIQKRRVAGLLADAIPDNEALKMRDGRYTCLVCKNRPVFDTTAMLTVHRRGKKHINAVHAQLHYQELSRLELERRQTAGEASLAPGTELPPLLAQSKTVSTAILTAASTSSVSDTRRESQADTGSDYDQRDNQPFFVRRQFEAANKESTGDRGGAREVCLQERGDEGSTSMSCRGTEQKVEPQYVFPWRVKKREKRKRCTDVVSTSKDDPPLAAVEYKKLRSAGWVMDQNGCWSKDPTVEFDSDEEEPPHPLQET